MHSAGVHALEKVFKFCRDWQFKDVIKHALERRLAKRRPLPHDVFWVVPFDEILRASVGRRVV